MTEALYSSYKNKCCLETWEMKDKLDRELYRKLTDADPFLELFDRLESLDSDTGNRPLLSDRELAYLEAWDNNFRDALELERKRKEADESICIEE